MRQNLPTSVLAGLAGLLLISPFHLHSAGQAQPTHGHAAAPAAGPLPSSVRIPLDAEARAGLPRTSARMTLHDTTVTCEGVPMLGLLRKAGVLTEPLRGPQLSRYVLISARDGYRVVYALAEFDPSINGERADALLADRCNDAPLDKDTGPLRLLFPADRRPARSARQIESITVVTAP